MATHSPMLMAYPEATLLSLTRGGLSPIAVEDTEHFRMMRQFILDPRTFVEAALAE
jgi:predicted ATPase